MASEATKIMAPAESKVLTVKPDRMKINFIPNVVFSQG